ncbi:hypothetical protein ACIQVR_06730 [Streptomyces xanthochromogenes]|uniref:hypothetical protein n=1 Tax=Streptomyces xanthochromogenes TaxID=67384 RepID=UPI0037F1412A
MLFKAPTGKVHSSLVDHDRCVFIRNNAKTDYSALSELPVDEYEAGDDCMNCESAVAKEMKSVRSAETPLPFENSEDPSENYTDDDEDDEWEDEDDFVADLEKKAKAERELGIRDADAALEHWELLAERATSRHGRSFWEGKIADLKARIEFIPESESEAESVEVEVSEESNEEEPVTVEEKKPSRRTAKKAVAVAGK